MPKQSSPLLFSAPSVSIIIPVYNGGRAFEFCQQSIKKLNPPPDEIIIVVDGGLKNSDRIDQGLNAKLLETDQVKGPARARNLGARTATSDLLFFIDADVTVSKDMIQKVRSVFTADHELSAAIGSYDDAPGEFNFLSQYRNLLHHYVHQTSSEEASTFWGACGIVRREIFLALEGFDENYQKPSIEDIELGYRLRNSGKRIKLCKDLQIKHLKRWTANSIVKTDFFCRAIPWSKLIIQNKTMVNDLNLETKSRISVMAIFGILGSCFGAIWWTGFILIGMLFGTMLLILNAPVYQFFYKKRGLLFMLGVVPWHWFYFLYSGVAYALCLLRFRAGNFSYFK